MKTIFPVMKYKKDDKTTEWTGEVRIITTISQLNVGIKLKLRENTENEM